MLMSKIVRQTNRNGPCVLLGPLLKQNGNAARPMIIYRTRTLAEASVPARLIHLEPCPRCADHVASTSKKGQHP
jgi:hypothetical protein